MKRKYWQTNFEEITPSIREQARIRGRAQGVELIPLAIGEQPPAEVEQDIQPDPVEEKRSLWPSFGRDESEEDEREG